MTHVILTIIFFLSLLSNISLADEGMWTFNRFPSDQLNKKYGFNPDKTWLDHVQSSVAKFASGCSGGFISKNGLVLTNHHCAHSCIEQLSTKEKDFIASGFYAKAESDEVKCPEIEIDQLVDISDVTQRINKVTKGLSDKVFLDKLKEETARIEKECAPTDDMRCDVISLYHGGEYNLYKYRRYQDVRLVFAPEFSMAFFGGDPDNFMYPRYDLDIALLRVYQKNAPLQLNHFFKWSFEGAKENDLTFVPGHPGSTERLKTVAEIEFQRDHALIWSLAYLSEWRGLLTEFQKSGEEEKRVSTSDLFYIENGLKRVKGQIEGLMDPEFYAKKIKSEKEFKAKVFANPKLKKEYGSAWDSISTAMNTWKNIYKRHFYIERRRGLSSQLYYIAINLVRASEELAKPNDKRLHEFTDASFPSLKQEIFSTAPVYDFFEIENLAHSLSKLREELLVDDPFVRKVFGPKSPREIAENLIKNSKLKDVKYREELLSGGKAAIEQSKDPMILFARMIDPEARAIRKSYEDNVESVVKKNEELIAKAYFAVYGRNTYPDATGTLRLSFGKVAGYKENGAFVKPITTIGGAFERNTGRDPFALPITWMKAKDTLDTKTPMNFCTTNDIIGGNSGSPVINKKAEVVGLIFDGNIQSLSSGYAYDDTQNRAVAVHTAAISAALEKIYKTERILKELK